MIVEVHSPSGWKVVSDATLQDLAVDSFLVILPLSKAIRSDRLPQLRIRIGGREAATVNLEAVEPAADGGSLVSYEVLLWGGVVAGFGAVNRRFPGGNREAGRRTGC